MLRAPTRGRTEAGWLDSRHSFSFADFHDPQRMGFRALRVLNDDRVKPGTGFGMHGHRDMEIISYVVHGVLEHRDDSGQTTLLEPGDVQRMSAGTGIRHSERNASAVKPLRFLQVWILPSRRGVEPSYETKRFDAPRKEARLCPIVAADGREGAIRIHQDVALYATVLARGQKVRHALRPGRHAFVQVVCGELSLNGMPMAEGDGAQITGEPSVELAGLEASEALLFDLA